MASRRVLGRSLERLGALPRGHVASRSIFINLGFHLWDPFGTMLGSKIVEKNFGDSKGPPSFTTCADTCIGQSLRNSSGKSSCNRSSSRNNGNKTAVARASTLLLVPTPASWSTHQVRGNSFCPRHLPTGVHWNAERRA